MNCEQTYTRLGEYVDGRLGQREHAALEVHAAACEQCGEALRAHLAIAGLLSELPDEAPPMGFSDRVVAKLTEAGLVHAPAIPAKRPLYVRPRYRLPLVAATFLVVALALFPALVQPVTGLVGKSAVALADGFHSLEEKLSTAQAFRNVALTLVDNLRTLKTVLFAAFSLLARLGEVLMFPVLIAFLAVTAGVFGYLRGAHRRGNASYSF